jgi:tetratricopeptide (TPR) repeat protein
VVAVFENRTGDPALDSLGMLALDSIQSGLQQIDRLTVATNPYGRTAQEQLQPSDGHATDPLQQLADATQSAMVVAGSYYLHGEEVEFQTRIVDPRQGKVVVSFDAVGGPRSDPSDAVDAVRRRAAGALAAHVDAIIQLGTERPPLLEAYREFQLGAAAGWRDRAAVSHLKRALEIDPDFVLARGMLCWTYKNRRQYSEAEAVCERLEADPAGRNHGRACRAALEGRWLDVLAASRDFSQKAPDIYWLRIGRGSAALKVNRPREAVEALEDVPYDWTQSDEGSAHQPFLMLGQAYHMLGDYEGELQLATESLDHFPDVAAFYGQQGDALAATDRYDEINRLADDCFSIPARVGTAGFTMRTTAEELRAHGHREHSLELAERVVDWYRSRPDTKARRFREDFARALEVAERWEEAHAVVVGLAREVPDSVRYQGWLGVAAARSGDRATAERVDEELRSLDIPYLYGKHTFWRTCIAAHLGERERAIELLRQAISQGWYYSVVFHRDLLLEPIRDYPPFQELIEPKG